MSQQFNYNKQYYLDIWNEMLRELLGWTEEETRRWAHSWTDANEIDPLDDPEDIFYHETPQYWAIDLLIPADCKERISHSEWLDLRQRIRTVFWDEHPASSRPTPTGAPIARRWSASWPSTALRCRPRRRVNGLLGSSARRPEGAICRRPRS